MPGLRAPVLLSLSSYWYGIGKGYFSSVPVLPLVQLAHLCAGCPSFLINILKTCMLLWPYPVCRSLKRDCQLEAATPLSCSSLLPYSWIAGARDTLGSACAPRCPSLVRGLWSTRLSSPCRSLGFLRPCWTWGPAAPLLHNITAGFACSLLPPCALGPAPQILCSENMVLVELLKIGAKDMCLLHSRCRTGSLRFFSDGIWWQCASSLWRACILLPLLASCLSPPVFFSQRPCILKP